MKPYISYSIKKTRILGFLVIISTLMLFSCSDSFLEITPEDRIDRASFYSSEQELITAVNGVYAKQRSLFNMHQTFYINDSRSDNAALDQSNQPERVESDVFKELTNNQELLTTWSGLYDIINHANAIIANDREVTGNSSTINRVVAEAKFLRAFTYFQIVITWGAVPLRLEPSVDFNNVIVPTSPANDVYDQIIKDLNESIADLPETYNNSKGNEIGRVTKWAALTLLGKVELQRGNKSVAEAVLRQVINKYSLLPNYKDIHVAKNDNTIESIFEISFNPPNNTGLGLPATFVQIAEAQRLGIPAGAAGQNHIIYPTQSLLAEFETGDLRAASTFSIAVSDGKPYISKFLDLNASSQGHNVNLVLLRYADVLLMLAESIGESDEAYELINQVRRRGFGFDPNVPNSSVDIGASTPGSFTEKVLHERRVEFAFEHQRWTDLKRIKSAQEIVDLMKAQLFQQEGKQFNITTNNLLFPIPILEIQLSNGTVTQNPGYDN